MSSDPSTQKWACEYCTYENWPSALKCTMCRGPKPLLGENIYRIGNESPSQDLIESTIDSNLALPNAPSSSEKPDNRNKGEWLCHNCTYINRIHATNCSTCHSHRPIASTHRADHVHSPLSDNSREFDGITGSASAASPKSTPSSTPLIRANNQEDVQSTENELQAQLAEKLQISQQRIVKWTCKVCTYENWPKAHKCVMCGMPNVPMKYLEKNNPAAPRNPPPSPDVSDSEDHQVTVFHETPALISQRNQPRESASVSNNIEYERKLRQLRQRIRDSDWLWLNACCGVVDGDSNPVETYLSSGGNPSRQLTGNEIRLLNRPSAFDVGHTLVHLAIRFHREDILAMLLTQIDECSSHGVKRAPSYIAPDLAGDIQRHVASIIRHRKGSFPCLFFSEFTTFTLPAEIEDLSPMVQEQLFEELLDRDAQQQLESDPAVLNWSLEVTMRLGSRLYALWNRSSGDCLLDSMMQATWGIFDQNNTLRRALSDSLHQCAHAFYPRWKESEENHAQLLHFSLDEYQWQEDWASLLSLASQPGSSLEQLHVFVLSHVLRRPIIVYGVKYVKSFRGEDIGYARFEGVYLPLLWEPSFCIRSPVALGYTRGHFSALVPMEPSTGEADNLGPDDLQVTFLPLMDQERKLLPVHFLTQSELGREEAILRQWLDVCVTEGGTLVAQQRLHKRPLLVAQMLEEWLNHYRRLVQVASAPYSRPMPIQDYSSDGGDSEDE